MHVMKSSRGQYVKTSMLRPCLHTILAHCGVVMPLRGWFLTLQKSRGRWSMMPRGGRGGIIPQTGAARARRRLMMTGHPSKEKRKLEKRFGSRLARFHQTSARACRAPRAGDFGREEGGDGA